MKESRAKLILEYVLPTILSQCAFFLFTIIDGIFVGHGVGADGLGAVNLAQPLVMVIGTAFMLTTIGGVTITATCVITSAMRKRINRRSYYEKTDFYDYGYLSVVLSDGLRRGQRNEQQYGVFRCPVPGRNAVL